MAKRKEAAPKKEKNGFDELSFDFGEGFADFELDLDSEFETRYTKPPRVKRIEERHLKYSEAAKLAIDVNPQKGERYFVIVNGSFFFGDFIEALLVEHTIYAKEVTISTLGMCQNNVDSLYLLLAEKYVNKLNLLVSGYFYSHERHDLVPYIYEKLDIGNRFQFAVAHTHCKMCLIETYDGRHIVIHGSANLRSSGNIEQFVIEESKDLYDFNKEYQDRIIEKFKTINKAIRNAALWDVVDK